MTKYEATVHAFPVDYEIDFGDRIYIEAESLKEAWERAEEELGKMQCGCEHRITEVVPVPAEKHDRKE